MSESSDTSLPAKKRKWPRRLLVTAIILLILGFLINGPVARWGVQYGLNKALEAQGMTGSLDDVSGSLISGFEIQNIDYSGTQGLQKIKIENIAIDYSIPELLNSKIQAVTLSNGDVIIDIAKFPPSPDKPKDPDAKLRETLATVHTWVSNADINIQNLNVDILNDEQRQAKFDIGELKHQGGTNDFKLDNFIAQDLEGRKTPSQDINIEWTPESANIDRFEVLPDIALKDLNFNWSDDLEGLAKLDFIDSNLDLVIDDTITAKLTSGTVSAKQISERFNLDLPIDFSINSLDATITNWKETPIPSWNLQGKLGTKQFSYDVYNLTDATLSIQQKDEKFNLSLNTKLNETPLILDLNGNWTAPTAEDWYSSFTTNYKLSSSRLGTLTELWYNPPLGLDLSPATVDAQGSFTLLKNEVTNATLTGKITNIQANKTTTPPLDITAEYAPNKPIQATLKSNERLAFEGSYDLSNSGYQGSLSVKENDPAWINALTDIFEVDVALEAPINLTWSGKGTNDPSKPQSGSLNVHELHLKLPDQPQFHITTDTEYDWPKTLNVKSLTARQNEWQAATNLTWDGNTINLPNLTINNGKTQLASANGTVPFTAQIDSLKTFLDQKDPINFSLKTKPLALQQIDEWLKLKAIKGVSGTAELDLEISGTPAKPNLKGKFETLGIKGLDDDTIKPIDVKLNFITQEKRLNITGSIFEADTNRLALDASLPYEPDTWINDPDFTKKIFDTGPIAADLKINTLPVQRFKNLLPENLKNLTGQLDAELKIEGSPKKNSLTGTFHAKNIQGIADDDLAPLNINLELQTEGEKLNVTALINEKEENRLTLKSTLPYTPSKWIDNPNFFDEFIKTAPLQADLDIKTLPLNRLKTFVPKLEKIDGTLSGTGALKGTIEDPKYNLNLEANVPLIKLKVNEIDQIRDTKLKIKMSEDRLVVTNLTAQINGGQFQADGTVNLTDYAKPIIDVTLKTRYALAHRDDLMSIRANTDLRLKGTIDEATISGTIGLAESLVYKDIELIPVGVPSSAAAKVKLPAADAAKVENLPIPEPFGNWKLDLTVRTDDPVLIRGNIAKGSVIGSIKVGGTLAKPAPSGTLFLNDIKAKLPFSILEIAKGQIRFSPEDALNPTLEIRGKSTVGSYDVSLFVYGPATSPKIAFTSYPPLPESEVMALLATGSTTSGLEDRDVATFKAFQIFLLKLRQKAEKPGGNKLFAKLLTGVEDLNLKVGEADQFTGKKYTSANVEITKKWHFTAQFDAEQNSRGLIVYVIRFR